MIDEEKRKAMRDAFDELDRYIDEMEKHVEQAVREGIGRLESRPFVTGFSFKMVPGGKPSVQVFGDRLFRDEKYRSPLVEQIVDGKGRKLKLVLDMPGVERNNIRIDATNDSAIIVAESGTRMYKADVSLRADVDPDSGKAEYKNGVLEISFFLKDKANKDFRRVEIV